MHPLSDDRLLGEYRLKELLRETPSVRTWLAEQTTVARLVLVDELMPAADGSRAEFLADIRAKAGVEHPIPGSVYEAVAEPGRCFVAHELLPGDTLAQGTAAGRTLPSARLAHVLRRVAEANLYLEGQAFDALPLTLEAIHVDEQGVVRITNLVVAGAREPFRSAGDITALGAALPALIAPGQPGATRLLTLLGWMRGEGVGTPIGWAQVRDYCLQIEHQLADPPTRISPREPKRKKVPLGVIAGGTAAVLVAIALVALKARPPQAAPPPRPPLPEDVAVSAGTYATPDGDEQALPGFLISAHEVTLGQYAEFLETLDLLAANQREKIFDLPDQPASKPSHVPDDWAALIAAAKAGGSWRGQGVTLDSPVVGVDWWDAAAYADWKKSRLPTQEEWFAALQSGNGEPATLPAGPWLPVTSQKADRTASGLLGMAGSVGEWTAKPASNPANPLGEKRWVIIGGSYLKPGSNALTREWTDDRLLRRPDLGFRVLHPPVP